MFSQTAAHQNQQAQRAPRMAFLVGAAVFVTMFGVLAQPMLSDPDTSWHLFFGEWILVNGKVPTQDAWSFTMAGQPWIAKEWLSQVLYALAFSLAGWNGVCGLAAGAIGLAFGLFAWFTSRRLG